MIGFFLGFFSAISSSASDTFLKYLFRDNSKLKNLEIFNGKLLLFLPILIILLLFSGFQTDKIFYVILFSAIPFEIVGQLLYIKAIREAPLSLTVPFLSFTPLFTIPLGYLILGEIPNFYGFLGIGFIILGVYSLNILKFKEGLLEPFKTIFSQKGSLLMIIVSFLFSITAVLMKFAIVNSSAIVFGVNYLIFLCLIITLINIIKNKMIFKNIYEHKKELCIPAIFDLLSFFAQYLAMIFIPVAYFMALKRTSILWSILSGGIIFKEDIKGPILGGFLILLGLILIFIFG